MNGGYGIERGCFTVASLHSSINDHREHAAEPHTYCPAARGAVIVTCATEYIICVRI